ncbi:hypothetical protein MHYMCMPSP_00765 [Hyalomma marginatum]|uniref:Uncharacterized protein n=1 Tax=Hyalomma marginatum TaxID=34627 RepID=A0A8S4C0Y9_9ACAR|nr:hypothetical protein MHYMCMPASI_00158 [Hyalomma marginatum]CAG7592986.1 hypothetical protein MHYMCMPSP_00765 [Hyalomma marginatum]
MKVTETKEELLTEIIPVLDKPTEAKEFSNEIP